MLKGIITSEDCEAWRNNIMVEYSSYNHFAELRNAELVTERLQTLDMTQQYVGEFYSKEWVFKNILNLNEEEIEQMKKEMTEEQASGETDDEDDEPQEQEAPQPTPVKIVKDDEE